MHHFITVHDIDVGPLAPVNSPMCHVKHRGHFQQILLSTCEESNSGASCGQLPSSKTMQGVMA